MGLGKRAYAVMVLVTDDMGGIYAAWIGGLVLASGATAIFAIFVILKGDRR